MRVAQQLSVSDRRLTSHLRGELGLEASRRARPVQAALVSAVAFASLAALPLIAFVAAPTSLRIVVVAVVSIVGWALSARSAADWAARR